MSEENLLIELLPDTMSIMGDQLRVDQKRWGDTWKYRTLEGQDQRMAARFQDYIDQLNNAGTPLPYEKIACLAHIALVRKHRTDLLLTGEENE